MRLVPEFELTGEVADRPALHGIPVFVAGRVEDERVGDADEECIFGDGLGREGPVDTFRIGRVEAAHFEIGVVVSPLGFQPGD